MVRLLLDLSENCSPMVHETNISNCQFPDSIVQLASRQHLIYLLSMESVTFMAKKGHQMRHFFFLVPLLITVSCTDSVFIFKRKYLRKISNSSSSIAAILGDSFLFSSYQALTLYEQFKGFLSYSFLRRS